MDGSQYHQTQLELFLESLSVQTTRLVSTRHLPGWPAVGGIGEVRRFCVATSGQGSGAAHTAAPIYGGDGSHVLRVATGTERR